MQHGRYDSCHDHSVKSTVETPIIQSLYLPCWLCFGGGPTQLSIVQSLSVLFGLDLEEAQPSYIPALAVGIRIPQGNEAA